MAEETLTVGLGDRSYDIVIGSGLIQGIGVRMQALGARRVTIITDSTVAGHYLSVVEAAIDSAGIERGASIVVAPGEGSKSLRSFQDVVETLLERGVERKSMLVALGGGVVGDLAGYVAAAVLRGIPFVQIPTTLLSQVDSSVGGKTGINSRHGKNLIGAFHQPKLVLADTDTLNTLPPRELRAGYAEVVKYGLINDRGFFDWLVQSGVSLLDGDQGAQIRAIRTSCASKAAVVAADEREVGQRALLNLGHTFGHALEAEAAYDGSLLHGEAVSIGMVMAFDLSVRLGLCPEGDAAQVRQHLESVGLPVSVSDRGWSADALMAHMGRDKKVADGKITFILVRGIGQAFQARDIDPADIRSFLGARLAA